MDLLNMIMTKWRLLYHWNRCIIYFHPIIYNVNNHYYEPWEAVLSLVDVVVFAIGTVLVVVPAVEKKLHWQLTTFGPSISRKREVAKQT